MISLWNSIEEFTNTVNPEKNHKHLSHKDDHFYDRFELIENSLKYQRNLENALWKLSDFGFGKENYIEIKGDLLKVRNEIIKIIVDGQNFLGLQKELSNSSKADDFIYEKDLLDHWDTYNDKRLCDEIQKLVTATYELLDGYYHLKKERERLFNLLKLPKEFVKDFNLAKDLLLTGFHDVSVLIAGRGLENILRNGLKKKKVVLMDSKGKKHRGNELDFKDLIELCSRLRWKKDSSKLITQKTKTLLDYLRSIRNSEAHPANESYSEGNNYIGILNILITEANSLYIKLIDSNARLEKLDILKDW